MARRRPLRKAWRSALLGVLTCALLASWTGCGTPEKRYRVLSFFFDGVPDPHAPAGGRTLAGQLPREVFAHKPYVEGNCKACHSSGMNSIFEATSNLEVDAHVCLKCHQRVLTEYPVMHGPVVVVECLRCHAPHESNTPHLLAAPSPNVCKQCHEPVLLSPRAAEHLNPKASCIDCHSAHGGERHGLLLAHPTTEPAPSTAPAAILESAPVANLSGRQAP